MAWPTTSRHERGYGAAWVRLRARIMRRDAYLCRACDRKGRVAPGTEVHHITPKAQGGTDDPTNLETLCHDCHVEADVIATGGATSKRYRVALDGTLIDG